MASTRKYVLLLILFVLVIYSNSFNNRFVWDDEFLIVKNPAIMSWDYAWIHFAVDLYHSFSNYYRPVQMISYMVDFSLWRLEPFGYHATNIILHICVSLALFLLLKLMTGDRRIAFVGSLFYAVHPAHTAAVTYIAGRADLLACLFSLLSLILLHKHFKAQRNRSAIFFYICSLAFFLTALLSKEISLVFPILILTYRLFFITDDEASRSAEIIKFHYMSWFIIIAGVYAVLRIHALNFQEDIFLEIGFPLYVRLLTSIKALGIYLGIIFLPLEMRMERSIPYVFSFFETGVLLSVLLFILMLWMAVRVNRISRHAFFGFMFFIITLLPVMNIYPLGNNMAEHWLYTPMIGMSIFLSCSGMKVWDRRRALRPLLTAMMIGYIVFFSYKTFDRNLDWRDEDTIYTHTFMYNPHSIKILNNLGNLYHKRGDLGMAMAFHNMAIEKNPAEHKTRLNLGLDYEAMGMLDEAMSQYRLSARLKPDYAKAYFNIGNIYAKKKDMDMAFRAYKRAAGLDELHIGARTNLGNIYFGSGHYEKAKEEYKSIIRINPYLPDARSNLGNALSELGLHQEAISEYKKAIELAPRGAEYHAGLGAVYGKAGMYEDAIEELSRAYMIKPRDIDTIINLGSAYFHIGNIDLAKKEWRKALRIDPQHPIALKYLHSLPIN